MKRIFTILAVAAAAIACTKEVTETTFAEGQTIFAGEFVNTKIALGDKEDGGYPAVWEAGDQLAIYNAADNTHIGTATLASESVGQRFGTFVLDQAIADGTQVKVVYPATETAGIAAEQTKVSASDKHLIAKAESETVTVQGQNATFALSQQNAIVKVDVSSTEFAGKLLKSVTIYSAGAAIANESDYARVTFTTPAAISANETQSAVFMTLPIATNTDFYVSVKLVDAQDELKTVSIPKKFTAKQLVGGKVNTIPFNNLASTDNAVAWYNPVCNRYIPEGGWCYGTSNTFVCAPIVKTSGTLDVRAQGEFIDVIRYAKEPKKIQMRKGDVVNTGTGNCWSINTTNPNKNVIVPIDSYNPTITFEKLGNSKKAVAGFVNLLDESDNIIWAYLLWAANVGETLLENGILMNMNLGGSSKDGGLAEQSGVYYQWGRPFPFAYTTTDNAVQNQSPVLISDFQTSASNANGIGVCEGKESDNNKDWLRSEVHRYDLWGNPETTTTSTGGKKSIFDPCPRGWKVASAAILSEVFANAEYVANDNKCIYKDDVWTVTSYRDGANVGRGGDDKGLYWADNALNDNHGLHFEFFPETTKDGDTIPAGKKLDGTWRANACAIRCMKDNDNR